MKRYVRKKAGRMIALAVTAVTLFAAPVSILAADDFDAAPEVTSEGDSQITRGINETSWVYMIDADGNLWGRLWSHSLDRWMTEWMIVE